MPGVSARGSKSRSGQGAMIQQMTCCVAALCADRKAIVLAADKMPEPSPV